MNTSVVIAAAGRGARIGAGLPKALLLLAGETLLARSARAFLDHPAVGEVVAVVPDPASARAALGPLAQRLRLVRGGEERQDSVRAGLEALGAADIVLVHDAARPFVEPALIDAVIDAARRTGAAVPGLPLVDTVKEVGADGRVLRTLPREALRAVQTPQGFRADLLRRAHAEGAGLAALTDDASLVERLGHPVEVVPGSLRNIKITTAFDLARAEEMIAASEGGERG